MAKVGFLTTLTITVKTVNCADIKTGFTLTADDILTDTLYNEIYKNKMSRFSKTPIINAMENLVGQNGMYKLFQVPAGDLNLRSVYDFSKASTMSRTMCTTAYSALIKTFRKIASLWFDTQQFVPFKTVADICPTSTDNIVYEEARYRVYFYHQF